MSSAPIFPFEIEEMIIDILADDKDYAGLKSCSLVCQAYLPSCRKHLFTHIRVRNDTRSPRMNAAVFEQLLSAIPEVSDYVRSLDCAIYFEDLTNRTFQDSLKRISRLESLSIWYYKGTTGPLDWSHNPIRPALLHLLHLPTLTYFSVIQVDKFVVTDLVPCVNLKRLKIGRHITAINSVDFPAENLPAESVQPHELIYEAHSAVPLLELLTARRPDGKPVVDLCALAKIEIELGTHSDGYVVQKFFEHCDKITDAHFTFDNPVAIRPTVASMLRPSLRALKRLAVEVSVSDYAEDPLFGIPAELEGMRGENIIESLELNVVVQFDETCSTGDVWGRLDEVLSKAGWPALERVSLIIDVCSFSRVPGDNEFEEVLRKLPETQLVRLSASESVVFYFEVNSILI